MPSREPLRTVLFDLDGTLADTAPDMYAALIALQREQGVPALPFEVVRNQVSHGGAALVRLAFPDAQGDQFETLRQRFLILYSEHHLCHETRLFPGMDALLQAIENLGLNWGIVTNKPAWLTDPLVRAMNLHRRAVTVISGDTTPQRKPHPLPMLLACEQAACRPAQCLYVGDAERDIQAGRAAGTHTLIALYGYIDETQAPTTWGADAAIDHPEQILPWLPAASRLGAIS
ncbi:HAD family hydrolase [Ectothiorhodospira lacustris]|uniref:HAD family hydrolase n=1 Tax=Ectothiorhodospira lacustris TaxID=2899127 RepID=UPI001EE8F695|nr:HAD-IA family hydrolase [Ectothiorhodospira lacustris]MCG5501276.1 HAD-IA family hydrolase [Ectothiorhodospira lacustris]MCG5509300.1 HAD-IA family hydrolase [Ectothiorhodospira lacustris]MCG5521354.1 HAD-IA family hydrolase [Ectothiorhodospira lacustris]